MIYIPVRPESVYGPSDRFRDAGRHFPFNAQIFDPVRDQGVEFGQDFHSVVKLLLGLENSVRFKGPDQSLKDKNYSFHINFSGP